MIYSQYQMKYQIKNLIFLRKITIKQLQLILRIVLTRIPLLVVSFSLNRIFVQFSRYKLYIGIVNRHIRLQGIGIRRSLFSKQFYHVYCCSFCRLYRHSASFQHLSICFIGCACLVLVVIAFDHVIIYFYDISLVALVIEILISF